METITITKEKAREIAEKNLGEYMLGEWGQRLVSDWESPFEAYIQEQNSHSMAGEVFSVKCIGLGNMDLSFYRKGWKCDNLSDDEVILEWCKNGDMTDEIEALAEQIFTSANEEKY